MSIQSEITRITNARNAIRNKMIAESQATSTDLIDTLATNLVISGGSGTLTGSTPPTSSQGSDGDVYIQKFPAGVLTSDGDCAINTGIYPNTLYTVETEAALTQQSSVYDVLFGVNSGNTGYFLSHFGNATNGSLYVLRSTTPTSSQTTFTSSLKKSSFLDTYHKLRLNFRWWEDDVVKKVFGIDTNNNITAFAYPLALFAGNYAGTFGNFAYMKCKYMKVWNDLGNLVAYLVPAEDNNEACMYEMISGTYKKNVSNGTFTYTANSGSYETILWLKENGSWHVVG